VDFVLKPFRDNELLECVERALAPSASNDSAARRKTEVM
jgi:FixJ family two-component response regulator